MRSTSVRAALAATLLFTAACGGGDDDTLQDWDAAPDAPSVDAAPREVIMDSRSLQAGELIEGLMTGGPADMAIIHLEAPVAELDWNIHGHAGGNVQTVFEELNKMTADYVFVPTADTDWWLLLRNSGPATMTVQVRVELYAGMQWSWK
jgi:hypothetical protein